MTFHLPLSEGRIGPSGALKKSKAINMVTLHSAQNIPASKPSKIMLSQNVAPLILALQRSIFRPAFSASLAPEPLFP